MDYYEELGISRTASAELVRHAYRQLARLMHPDQQLDESLRRLAETQMKRLNMVLAVLCDEERRRAYDLSLDARIAQTAHYEVGEGRRRLSGTYRCR